MESLRFRWTAVALIVVAAGLRLVYLAKYCPFDLSSDEAYYWDWSRQLDWSYHSKGPLVAWLIRLSCCLFGDTMFAVRLPAVVCGSLLLAGLYTLTYQVYGNDRLALAVMVLAMTVPVLAAGSMLMTIDAPFACAWMWALVCVYHAVFRQAGWAWPAAGICILIGILAKHTMVLWIPSFALFLLTTPTFRPYLARSGFWVMTGIGSLGGIPILVWNGQHGWVTLRHSQSHAGLEENVAIHWLGPLSYLGAQSVVLLGFWFIVWARAMWEHRPTRAAHPELRFLWWMSAPAFVFFGMFAFLNGGGEANWPLVGYVSGVVLAAGTLAQQMQTSSMHCRRWRAAMAGSAAVGLLLIALLHQPVVLQPVLLRLAGPATEREPMPVRRLDPTARLRGWRYLAAEVDGMRAELQTAGVDPVLAAERWTQAGELAFYCQGQPAIFCLGVPVGDRTTQYDLWRPNPVADADLFLGRSFILVGLDLHRFGQAFASTERTRVVSYREGDCPIAQWEVVVAHGFRGWGKLNEIKMD